MPRFQILGCLFLGLLIIATSTPAEAQLFGRRNDDSAVRIGQLEERIRILTGQIEQLSFQLREMQDQMRRMQEDNEYRFQQLEGGNPRKRSDVAPNGGASTRASNDLLQPGTLRVPSGELASLPTSGSGDGSWDQSGGYSDGFPSEGPVDLSALANGAANLAGPSPNLSPDLSLSTDDDQIAQIIGSGDPQTDYNEAYSRAVNGDYAGAEVGFRTFLETYPGDRLSANAQYWLGESLLAQQNYREAADAFLKTYTEHPGNSKGPDSLLKLGVSLRGLGEADAACATFSELLSKFPNAAPAVLSQARDERRRAQCA